jgi:hypothetical protein
LQADIPESEVICPKRIEVKVSGALHPEAGESVPFAREPVSKLFTKKNLVEIRKTSANSATLLLVMANCRKP